MSIGVLYCEVCGRSVSEESGYWEKETSRVFSAIFPELGSAEVTSDTSKPDILLLSRSPEQKVVGVVEVKSPLDEKWTSLHKAIAKAGGPAGNLPDGSGTWNVLVNQKFNGKTASRVISSVVAKCIDKGISSFYVDQPQSDDADFSEYLSGLGISHVVFFHKNSGDKYYLSTSRGGFISGGMVGLRDWISRQSGKKSFQNSLNNLRRFNDVETHLFVWILDGAPDSLFYGGVFFPEEFPKENPIEFEGVSTYWFGMPQTASPSYVVWRYTCDTGWAMYRVPRDFNR